MSTGRMAQVQLSSVDNVRTQWERPTHEYNKTIGKTIFISDKLPETGLYICEDSLSKNHVTGVEDCFNSRNYPGSISDGVANQHNHVVRNGLTNGVTNGVTIGASDVNNCVSNITSGTSDVTNGASDIAKLNGLGDLSIGVSDAINCVEDVINWKPPLVRCRTSSPRAQERGRRKVTLDQSSMCPSAGTGEVEACMRHFRLEEEVKFIPTTVVGKIFGRLRRSASAAAAERVRPGEREIGVGGRQGRGIVAGGAGGRGKGRVEGGKRKELALTQKMSDGRRSRVELPDDRTYELVIQGKLTGSEFRDLVASHISLKEKEFFGLTFKDSGGHWQWVQLDKRVLDQDLPKSGKDKTLIFQFQVRLFVSSISRLHDNVTIELFFHQAKRLVFKDELECDVDTVFELAAYVLQFTHGNFTDETITRNQMKQLPVLPKKVLKLFPSLPFCEDKVFAHYKRLAGQTKGSVIVNYMSIVENLPTYGVHFYDVKDPNGLPWWLGVSFRGISVYDIQDRKNPRTVYSWRNLENLFYRDKKFSIEVRETVRRSGSSSATRTTSSASGEPGSESGSVSRSGSRAERKFTLHSWLATTTQVAKCIWTMAVAQHKFYIDCKHGKLQLGPSRCLADVAADLNRSTPSIAESLASSSSSSTAAPKTTVSLGASTPSLVHTGPGLLPSCSSVASLSPSRGGGAGEDAMIRSSSAHCLRVNSAHPGGGLLTVSDDFKNELLAKKELDARRSAQLEMHRALTLRKDQLKEKLEAKLALLRELCLEESKLTGVMPDDYPRQPGEATPQARKKVGTAFTLSPQLLSKNEGDDASKLELECAVQSQIVTAALRLAKDKTLPRNVRKMHKLSYRKASQKLTELQEKMNICRRHEGKTPVRVTVSMDDLSEDSAEFLDDEDGYSSSPTFRRPSGGNDRADADREALRKRSQRGTPPRILLRHNSVPHKMEGDNSSVDAHPSSLRSTTSSSSSLASLKDSSTPSPSVKGSPLMLTGSALPANLSSGYKVLKKIKTTSSSRPTRSRQITNEKTIPEYTANAVRVYRTGYISPSLDSNIVGHPLSMYEASPHHPHHQTSPSRNCNSSISLTSIDSPHTNQHSSAGVSGVIHQGSSLSALNFPTEPGSRAPVQILPYVDPLNRPNGNEDLVDGEYKSYIERTQTWPSKRGSIGSVRNDGVTCVATDSVQQCVNPVYRPASQQQHPILPSTVALLAELSPSKFGSKRESTVDESDSPYRFDDAATISAQNVQTAPGKRREESSGEGGERRGGDSAVVEKRRVRVQHRSNTPGRTSGNASSTNDRQLSATPEYSIESDYSAGKFSPHVVNGYTSPVSVLEQRQDSPQYDSKPRAKNTGRRRSDEDHPVVDHSTTFNTDIRQYSETRQRAGRKQHDQQQSAAYVPQPASEYSDSTNIRDHAEQRHHHHSVYPVTETASSHGYRRNLQSAYASQNSAPPQGYSKSATSRRCDFDHERSSISPSSNSSANSSGHYPYLAPSLDTNSVVYNSSQDGASSRHLGPVAESSGNDEYYNKNAVDNSNDRIVNSDSSSLPRQQRRTRVARCERTDSRNQDAVDALFERVNSAVEVTGPTTASAYLPVAGDLFSPPQPIPSPHVAPGHGIRSFNQPASSMVGNSLLQPFYSKSHETSQPQNLRVLSPLADSGVGTGLAGGWGPRQQVVDNRGGAPGFSDGVNALFGAPAVGHHHLHSSGRAQGPINDRFSALSIVNQDFQDMDGGVDGGGSIVVGGGLRRNDSGGSGGMRAPQGWHPPPRDGSDIDAISTLV